MILTHEVSAALAGRLSTSELINVIEHMELGGFHSDVPHSERKALLDWLHSLKPLPDRMVVPVHPQQLTSKAEQLVLL